MSSNPTQSDIAATFDRRARSYNQNAWHRKCAERLVALCEFAPQDRILDACTGTGFAAMAAARVVGRQGRITAIDVSDGMLAEAQKSIDAAGHFNIELRREDASSLPGYSDGVFDGVTCAAGLLYLDVSKALREWHRLLKEGGVLAFSAMRAGAPRGGQVFRDCAATFGVTLQDPSESLGSIEACERVLSTAGFTEMNIVCEPVDFMPQDLAVAWESNFHSPAHAGVRGLSLSQQQQLRTDYLDALARLAERSPEALRTAEVIYAIGRRSSRALQPD